MPDTTIDTTRTVTIPIVVARQVALDLRVASDKLIEHLKGSGVLGDAHIHMDADDWADLYDDIVNAAGVLDDNVEDPNEAWEVLEA